MGPSGIKIFSIMNYNKRFIIYDIREHIFTFLFIYKINVLLQTIIIYIIILQSN